jgi:hypothetical protein
MTNIKHINQGQEEKAQQQDLLITFSPSYVSGEEADELFLENIKGFQVGVNIMQVLKEDGTTLLIPISRLYEVSNSFKEVL